MNHADKGRKPPKAPNTLTARIGPAMARVAAYVARHPGCSAFACAKAIGPNGSAQYGYRAVHRALRAGLIGNEGTGARYALVLT